MAQPPIGGVLKDILAQQTVSVDALLAASYGEWPPRGLEIVHANPQKVLVTDDVDVYSPEDSPEKKQETLLCLGSALSSGPRRIFVNTAQDRSSSQLLSTLHHETVHILQGDHYAPRAIDVLGMKGQEHLAKEGDYSANIHAAPLFSESKPKRFFLRSLFNIQSSPLPKRIAYLAKGIEIQARLAQILSFGYRDWQRLPETKTELYFFLQGSKIKLPKSVRKTIARAPQKGFLRRSFAPVSNNFEAAEIDFNFSELQLQMSKKSREMFWHETLPRLYCDLIEMYGDRYGRERFGYGRNEIHEMRSQYQEDLRMIKQIPWLVSDDEDQRFGIRIDNCHPNPSAVHATETALQSALTNLGIGSKIGVTYSGERWLLVSEKPCRDRLVHLTGFNPNAPSPVAGRGRQPR